MKNHFLFALLLLLSLFPLGCTQVISKQAISESESNVYFQDLVRNPEKYLGRKVILGGTIVAVHNGPQEGHLEILQRPLGYQYEPELGDRTDGRFLVMYPHFIDPEVYRKDRKITVAGEVLGGRNQPLDQISYRYPVISMKENYLWPENSYSIPQSRFSIGLGFFGTY